MRTLYRVGAAVGSLAVGASLAFAGAGVASADVVTKSPHSVSVSSGIVTVKNGGDKTLQCTGVSTTERLAKLLYRQQTDENYTPSLGDLLAYSEAVSAGKITGVAGNVPANSSGPLSNVTPGTVPGSSAVVNCYDGSSEHLLISGGGGAFGSLGGLTGSLGS